MILEDSGKSKRKAQFEWPGLFGGYRSGDGNGYGVRLIY
jgi:hypothetical protein